MDFKTKKNHNKMYDDCRTARKNFNDIFIETYGTDADEMLKIYIKTLSGYKKFMID